MLLTDEEKSILEGQQGLARQKALELLVQYAEALGAERFIETNNVIGAMGALGRVPGASSFDHAFSQYFLESKAEIKIPPVRAFSCQVINMMDPDHWDVLGFKRTDYEIYVRIQEYCAGLGIQMMNTCTPYLLGNVPAKGEHCAWMESSAVVYCNSVLGGRTNTEGTESAAASMLVGRTPYWGYHIEKNRRGTHLVTVECDVESVMDWGLLGYYTGEMVKEQVPVITGIKWAPNIARLKHCGAAAASSGGIELYHVVGYTPEAPTKEAAFGDNKPLETFKYGKQERKKAYEMLSSGKGEDVDFIMMGCPHYTLEQLWDAGKLLEGKKISSNVNLWIFTPNALKKIADFQGLTALIEKSGALVMSDTCPAICRRAPKEAKVAATDSGKQTHYLPAILGLPTYFGSQKDCIDAAISGKWRGDLK